MGIDNDAGQALLTAPVEVGSVLLLLVSLCLAAAGFRPLRPLFRALPAAVWIYLLAVTLGSLDVLPSSNAAYDVFGLLFVPLSLFLLTVSADFRSVLRVGSLATLLLVAGTSGILLGGLAAFLAARPWLADPAIWKGFAVLSGMWIGGSANGVAVQQGLDAAPALIGPLLIVDTMVGYGWVVLLLFLGSRQQLLQRLFRCDAERAQLVARVEIDHLEREPLRLDRLGAMIGAAVLASGAALVLGGLLPELGDPTVVTATTWAILLVVAIGVLLSFTPLRRLEAAGASDVGYFFMLLLLASLGARGDFSAFLAAPLFLLCGFIWLAVHLLILGIAARLLRAPPVLFALGSVANVGGFVTAPIVAASYNRNMVPTALLLAAMAQVLGIYLPFAFAAIVSRLAGA
jgi:uncharacterized membrane protein